MDDVALAGLEHANMLEAVTLAAIGAPGSLVRREEGVCLLLTGLPLRLFNQVLVADGSATHATVESAVATARARGDRFVVNLRTGTDDRFLPLMSRLGLEPIAETPWMPGMAMHPATAGDQPTAPDLDIAVIADEAGLRDHVQTAAAGFEMSATVVEAVVGPAVLRDPRAVLYVGYAGGEPVSTGLGVRTGRTIGLYNISTVPGARRRGYGLAMTRRICADGIAAGCDVAILQASAMGYPIYERLGFRTVVAYAGYVDPDPTKAASLDSE